MNDQIKGDLDAVVSRTQLAGSNKMEILLFSLGTGEVFGINVFKVREVCTTPAITKTPNMPAGVKGLISLRGTVIPVMSLGEITGVQKDMHETEAAMMVAEYNKKTLGFLVESVDRIVRVDWDRVRAPENMANAVFITAVTHLDDGRLVSILDVESILSKTFGESPVGTIAPIEQGADKNVFFVDDSLVARKKIIEVLDKMGVKHKQAQNGKEAWERLQAVANFAEANGRPVSHDLNLILVDAEMPEMDGYVLTKHIKADARFDGIPVVMHSSLSSEANRAMGTRVGVDAYVAKFDSDILSNTLRPLL